MNCLEKRVSRKKIQHMKSVGQAFKIGILAIVCLSFAIIAPGQSFLLYSASNVIPTNPVVLNNTQPARDAVLPVIEMTNVPLSRAIRRLMRHSGMRFIIDPRLQDDWRITNSDGRQINNPMLDFRWTNMTASAALLRLLKENHLVVEEDPVTLVPQITYDCPSTAAEDGYGTNAVPLIQFEDVPITVLLQALARAGCFNYMFDPEIRFGGTDRYGQIIREPEITMSWTNATAEQAFAWVCFNNHLVVNCDPNNGVLLVRYRGHDVDFVNADVYANDTNILPSIELKDVPLSLALRNLARQARLKCILSPRINAGDLESQPLVNLRWEKLTGAQAFAAVCESYDLGIIKYPVSGVLAVEPNN